MAIRNLRYDNDPILRKKSREIKEINERIKILIEDMLDTMYKHEGIGLAAPQVGVLRRAIVIDIGDGPLKMINPEIVHQEGENLDIEGCLSIPNRAGMVNRPKRIKVKYLDMDGNIKEIEGEGLLSKALCHEIDHLDGILYTDIMVEEIFEEDEKEKELKEDEN